MTLGFWGCCRNEFWVCGQMWSLALSPASVPPCSVYHGLSVIIVVQVCSWICSRLCCWHHFRRVFQRARVATMRLAHLLDSARASWQWQCSCSLPAHEGNRERRFKGFSKERRLLTDCCGWWTEIRNHQIRGEKDFINAWLLPKLLRKCGSWSSSSWPPLQ